MVTHDQGEAFAMADHVGVMDGGRILQWDTPAGLYARPAHRYVAGFVGRGALVPATALGLGEIGRASCRERMCLDVSFRGVAESITTKMQYYDNYTAKLLIEMIHS